MTTLRASYATHPAERSRAVADVKAYAKNRIANLLALQIIEEFELHERRIPYGGGTEYFMEIYAHQLKPLIPLKGKTE